MLTRLTPEFKTCSRRRQISIIVSLKTVKRWFNLPMYVIILFAHWAIVGIIYTPVSRCVVFISHLNIPQKVPFKRGNPGYTVCYAICCHLVFNILFVEAGSLLSSLVLISSIFYQLQITPPSLKKKGGNHPNSWLFQLKLNHPEI